MSNETRFEEDRPAMSPVRLVLGILFLVAALLSAYLCFARPVIDTPLYSLREDVLMGLGGDACPLVALFFAWFGVLFLRRARGHGNGAVFALSGTLLFIALFTGVHLFYTQSILDNLNLHTYANFIVNSFDRHIGGGFFGALLAYPLFESLGLALSVTAVVALVILCLAGMGLITRLVKGLNSSPDERRMERMREKQRAERIRQDDADRRRRVLVEKERRPDPRQRRRTVEPVDAPAPEPQKKPRPRPQPKPQPQPAPAPRRRAAKNDASTLAGDHSAPEYRRVSKPDRRQMEIPSGKRAPVTGHREPVTDEAAQEAVIDIVPEEEIPAALRRDPEKKPKARVDKVPENLFMVHDEPEDEPPEEDKDDENAFVPVNYDAPKPKKRLVVEGVRSLDLDPKPEKPAEKPAPPPKKEEKKPRGGLFSRRDFFDDDEDTYNYPPIDLLAEGEGSQDVRVHKEADARKAQDLIAALRSFGIDMKLMGIAHGPAVTRFELQPPPGVKVSRITALSDDIALHLAAETVRIEAPIPGKPAVGVEIPNEKRESVHLRDVLESQDAIHNPSRLAVGLGKDNAGRFIIADIAKMPHVLIAGQTGSGKSVCVNSIICSILMRATPDEVRMILIDPKVVELSVYNGIPHLIAPVVTDPKKAASALDWAVAEMSRRYKVFAERGVRDIKGFNKALEDGEKPMPQMVIIIDELADLMMVAQKNVEESICRLAQLARACGMHLVIATQRPSVNVVTGIIKANIPSRIAFAVSSITDSRVMLDYGGAEKLLGNGDMLFVPPATSKSVRVQGSWISDDEVHAIVQFIQSRCDANYDEDVIERIETAAMSDGDKEDHENEERNGKLDPKLQEAIEIVVEAGQASVSMLQRRMRVGYARAGRLIDEMEQRGIVSFADGSKPRNVLMSREEMLRLFEEEGE